MAKIVKQLTELVGNTPPSLQNLSTLILLVV